MSAGQADEKKWYYCARDPRGTRPGAWIVNGPYATYEEAMAEREKSKAFGLEVTVPFRAGNRAEAETICDTGRAI